MLELAAGANDWPDLVGRPGWKSDQAVLQGLQIDVPAGRLLGCRDMTERMQPQFASAERLGLRVEIIDRAQDSFEARVSTQGCALGSGRNIHVRAIKGTITVRGQFELDRSRQLALRAGCFNQIWQGVEHAFSQVRRKRPKGAGRQCNSIIRGPVGDLCRAELGC